MQILKKALTFLLRLLVVDSILLLCTWVNNLALSIRGMLAPYALSMKTSDVIDLSKVNEKIMEIEESVYIVQKDHTKHVDKDMQELRKQIEDMAKDLYEDEEATVLNLSGNQAVLS